MVNFAIMKANKPAATPNCYFISSFVGRQSPKSYFFGQKSTPKITPLRRLFFRQKIVLKLQQFSRQYHGISSCNFFSLSYQCRATQCYKPPILYPLFCFQFETFWNPSCLVPRPHYSARQKCFGSRGPSLGYVTEVN